MLLCTCVDTRKPLAEDEFTEILCVDEIDLSNCKIRHMPNFEHTCINKISLAHNSLANKQHLVISKFSTYFMDYMDLQWNNITELKPIISNQKFKEDSYSHKNSPTAYFMGAQVRANVMMFKLTDHFFCFVWVEIARYIYMIFICICTF